MSTRAALVYIRKDGLLFLFCYLSLSSFEFGLSSEDRARTLLFMRGRPALYLLFDLLNLYQ